MSTLSLREFAGHLTEIMSVIIKEFLKYQTGEFYKTRITLPQFFVMDMLNRRGESRMTDLARFINVTTAAMTGVVDRLVRDGYAMRTSDPNDRRIIKIRLTPKGDRTVKRIIERRRQMIMKIFGMISQAEREEYLKILTHIRDRLKE